MNEKSTSFGGGKRGWQILSVLFVIYLSDYADRTVVAGMIDFIKADWKITDAQAGWLISIVLSLITVFTVPASIFIDRWSRRKTVAIMTFFWSLATLACAFTQNYTQLIIARAFVGIGEAGYAPGGTALLAGAFPEKSRAKAMGIWNASIPLGMGIGLAAGGLIAKKWGWHHAFGIVSIPGMFLAVLAWFMPDYKTVKPTKVNEKKYCQAEKSFVEKYGRSNIPSFAFNFLKIAFRVIENIVNQTVKFLISATRLFRIPSLVFTYLGFAMMVSTTTCLMTWLSAYLERSEIVPAGKGGVMASGVMALVLFGAPLGGFLSDVWYRRNKKGRMLFPALSSAVAALLLWMALLNNRSALFLPAIALFGVTVTCFIAPAVAVTQDVVHPGMRAFSYALNVIVQHVMGDIWSAPLIGWISDRIGLEKAMLFLPVYCLFGAMFFFIGSRFYVCDAEKVEKVELLSE